METGRVDFSVYTFYIKSMGLHFFGSSILFMIIYQVLNTATSVFLSKWSDEENQVSNFADTESIFNSSEQSKELQQFNIYKMPSNLNLEF